MLEDRILRFEKAKNSFIPEKPFHAIDDNGLSKVGGYPPGELLHPDGIHHPSPFVHGEYVIPFYPEYDQIDPAVYQVGSRSCSVIPGELYLSDFVPLEEGSNKIFVSRLNGELVTQRKILRHFQQYGHITDIELFKNNLDGSLRPEAFAFISYLKPDQMLEAIRSENGNEWLGRRLKCCRALKKRGKNFISAESNADEFEVTLDSVDSDSTEIENVLISG